MKVIAFLAVLYNAYILDANGFTIINALGALIGLAVLMGTEVLSRMFFVAKENINAKDK